VKAFSSASTQQVSPLVPTRYSVSVQCSSVGTCIGGTEDTLICDVGNPAACLGGGGMCMPGGCDDTAFVTVHPVDPAACGNININLTCAGGGLCTAASQLRVNFLIPAPGFTGIDLDRGTMAEIMATPIVSLGTNVGNGLHVGAAAGLQRFIADTPGPCPLGTALFYLASCDAPGPKPSGNQNLGGVVSPRFQNP